MYRTLAFLCGLLTCQVLSLPPLLGQAAPSSPNESLRVDKALLLSFERQGEGRRRFFRGFRVDPMKELLVKGSLGDFVPKDGEELEGIENARWKEIQLDENGATEERGLYLHVTVNSKEKRHALLKTTGGETYVNGVPRCGNVYGYGYVELPIALREGDNHILLRAGRKPLQAQVSLPTVPFSVSEGDQTLPDLVVGETSETWAAVIVRNASAMHAKEFSLEVQGAGFDPVSTAIPDLMPATLRKVGFRIRCLAPQRTGGVDAAIVLCDGRGREVHRSPVSFKIVAPDTARRVTFVSEIDGSVQYYGLRQALPEPDGAGPLPAVVLSCHGASVEGIGQAAAHGPRRWFHVVAPTNRRPYGFDWEDIGRMDAMEVLGQAKATLPHDPSRTYVTGHSMGGHGTWHLGVTYPDQFAAVGPSAGWISRATYVDRRRRGAEEEEPNAVEKLIERSHSPSDTLALVENLSHHAVYILHGGDDNNVPASQARTMVEELTPFHHDWQYHEEPGKNHWWSNQYGDKGSACVDWPFMFDAFARHARPPSFTVRQVKFATANPGISSRCHWLEILQQEQHMGISEADLHLWPNKGQLSGTTKNVALMKIDLSALNSREAILVEVDGQRLESLEQPDDQQLYLGKTEGQWTVVEAPSPSEKGPHRYGGPKDVLGNHFQLVFGTAGSEAENAWAFAKAQQDAETYWYRGNASVDVLSDKAFLKQEAPDRSVVLYGNAESNAAWPSLLGDGPVRVDRGGIHLGDRHTAAGSDLSAIFVRPRPGSDRASVIAMTGTGLPGLRSLFQRTLFVPFVRFPDVAVYRGGEPIAAGFFGSDWSVEKGEWAVTE